MKFICSGSKCGGDRVYDGALEEENLVAPFYFLAFAGCCYGLYLWTSKKAKSVIETEQNLSRQGDGTKNIITKYILSRFIVRSGVYVGQN
jgi:hypothetical protein